MSTKAQKIAVPLVEPSTSALKRNIVVVIAIAKSEGRSVLTDPQYVYVTDILKRLVHFLEPNQIQDLSIDRVEEFFELRLKGSALGKKNLRIFFGYFPDTHELVVVRVWQKDNEDQTPVHIKINVRTRLRKYRAGELRTNVTRYTKSE